MSGHEFVLPLSDLRRPSDATLALMGVGICAVIWGTTWFAITLQLGRVAPLASIVWRFGLASILLFIGCFVFRQSVRLTRTQHLAALAQGAFAFSISYSFTYAAEGRIPSAVVAVIFASLAFVNLILFRVAAGQRAALASWAGALLGVFGVGVLSAAQAAGEGGMGAGALAGVGFAALAVIASAFGNLFAWKGQQVGSAVIPSTAWAMAYGTGLLALFGLATGTHWSFEPTPAYVGSLLYLSVFGSVIAFGLYFTIARARGYALASYISALTPPIAMLVSVVFEGARFGWLALVGLVLVLSGQVLLIRAQEDRRRLILAGRVVDPGAIDGFGDPILVALRLGSLGLGASKGDAVRLRRLGGLGLVSGLPYTVQIDDIGHEST